MITVTATELRKRILEYLDMISAGQTIVVIRNNKEVAKLTPTQRRNWQDGMEEKIEIKIKIPLNDYCNFSISGCYRSVH